MIIAVDFDGTISSAKWPAVGPEVPGALGAMRELHDDGHYLIIWTCRQGTPLTTAINWLLEQGIPFDRINDDAPHSVETFGEPSKKVYADVYVDDKQIGGFPGWEAVVDYINSKK